MKTYNELVLELATIRNQGYVRSHRHGDTGIGKTLEDLLGIDENNIPGPNGHSTELKSYRSNAKSMLTLFTKAPKPKGVNRMLLERFGHTSRRSRKELHTTVTSDPPTRTIDGRLRPRRTLYGGPGFWLTFTESRIELSHVNYGSIPTPYWDMNDLKAAFHKKYPGYLLYVKADSRTINGQEYLHYNEAHRLSEFSFENFTQRLEEGKIVVDIRIGQYPDGSPHDHGTGFRVLPDNLGLCFSRRERVL